MDAKFLSLPPVKLAVLVSGAFALGCGLTMATAYQPHMQNALAALQNARSELVAAEPNKGGHRERALDLVDRAIDQVQQGIAFAASNS
jgi:hypothetical protein